MDASDVEHEALRREVERLRQLVITGHGAYRDLVLTQQLLGEEPDYGAPLPEEDDTDA